MQRIVRFAPVQAAKVMGILYAFLGVIFMPIFFLASLTTREGFGVAFALMMPVLYGALGALSGLVGSVLYNLVASWVGGFEIELAPAQTEGVVVQ